MVSKKFRVWTSIIEVVLVITILTLWIVWVYEVLNWWQKLAISTENRIKAINIAREWLEAVQNIRDTNWIKFSSDYANCWNVDKYNWSCIWDSTSDIRINSWSYILSNSWWLWYLSWVTSPSSSYNNTYRTQFPVYFDANWLISQNYWWSTRCTTSTNTWCLSIFTREILISYSSTEKINVKSVVKWVDSSSSKPLDVILETTLTNWKEDL